MLALLALFSCAPAPSSPEFTSEAPDLPDLIEVTENPCALGEAPACPAESCLALLNARPETPSGAWWLDLGEGPVKAQCEMQLDGGGWTLIARFDHSDGEAWIPREGLEAWEGDAGFGALEGSGDYRSPAFVALAGADLLATDSEGGWAAMEGALLTPDGAALSLAVRLRAEPTCTDAGVEGLDIRSSEPLLEDYGVLSFFGLDPWEGRCALNPTAKTRAAVIGLAHNGCGSFGFGQLDGAEGDAGSRFCLAGEPDLDRELDEDICREWFGEATVHSFAAGCGGSALWVR